MYYFVTLGTVINLRDRLIDCFLIRHDICTRGRHRRVAVFTPAYAISSKVVSLIVASGKVY